jgi:hypothetical protein
MIRQGQRWKPYRNGLRGCSGASRPRKDLATMTVPSPYAQNQPDPAALIQRSLNGIIELLKKINEKLDQLVKARSSGD